MHGGNQGAVGPLVDVGEGVSQPQQAGTEHGEHGTAQGPVQGQFVRVRQARAAHRVVGIDRHADQRQWL
ncbi:hypothetical protein D3C81_1491690 [compost metagenome]